MTKPKDLPTKKVRAAKDTTVTARHNTVDTVSIESATTVIINSETDNLGIVGAGKEKVTVTFVIQALYEVGLTFHAKTQLLLTLTAPPVITTPSPALAPPNVATASL